MMGSGGLIVMALTCRAKKLCRVLRQMRALFFALEFYHIFPINGISKKRMLLYQKIYHMPKALPRLGMSNEAGRMHTL